MPVTKRKMRVSQSHYLFIMISPDVSVTSIFELKCKKNFCYYSFRCQSTHNTVNSSQLSSQWPDDYVCRPTVATKQLTGILLCSYQLAIASTREAIVFIQISYTKWCVRRMLNNIVTLKSGLEVTQGHWKWYHLKAWVQFPIRLP